jgi:hypothetical protein
MMMPRTNQLATGLALAVCLTVGAQSGYAKNKGRGGKSFGGKSMSRGVGGSNSLNTSQKFNRSRTKVSHTGSSQGKWVNQSGLRNRLQTNNKVPVQKNQIRNSHQRSGRFQVGNGSLKPKDLRSKTNPKQIINNGKLSKIDRSRIGLDRNKLGISKGDIAAKLKHRNAIDSVRGKVQNHLKTHKNLGHLDRIAHRISHNRKHHKVCVDHRDWCHIKPRHCHWWYNWCAPIRYCEPVHHVSCHWDYVQCDYVAAGQVVVADARWYLGLKGLLLPGKGLGIEEVTPGSPADAVSLQAGMVIVRCNGVDLVDEQALADVIAQSQGVLRMDLLMNADETPATCVVVMQRIASVDF